MVAASVCEYGEIWEDAAHLSNAAKRCCPRPTASSRERQVDNNFGREYLLKFLAVAAFIQVRQFCTNGTSGKVRINRRMSEEN